MSTRRAGDHQFDHGAQYFTAHGDAFRTFLSSYIEQDTVALWQPRLVRIDSEGSTSAHWRAPRYVGVPAMNSLCKEMANGMSVQRGVRAIGLERVESRWRIDLDNGESTAEYDWVLSTAPSVQTAALMPELAKDTAAGWDDVVMKGCFSLMMGFTTSLDLPWDAATVSESPLAWIAVNNTKPGRTNAVSVLCQADNDWSDRNMEADLSTVQEQLCAAFERATGVDASKAAHVALHRWRYAKVLSAARSTHLLSEELRLGAAGDWFGCGRVEAAFDSAEALASALLDRISG